MPSVINSSDNSVGDYAIYRASALAPGVISRLNPNTFKEEALFELPEGINHESIQVDLLEKKNLHQF